MSEDRAAEIVAAARADRKRSSRALWIAAALIGGICVIAFVVLMFGNRDSSTTPTHVAADSSLGFGAGVLIGAVVGVVIGYAIARQSSRNTP